MNAESNSMWQDAVCLPRGSGGRTEIGWAALWPRLQIPNPSDARYITALHVSSPGHHSFPPHWLLYYDISLHGWLMSHLGIGWGEVINIEEPYNRWTFAVNTGWLMMDLLLLRCWFLKWLITSIWPLIAQSDSQFIFAGKKRNKSSTVKS